MTRRIAGFVGVGAAGFAIQIALLAWLTTAAGWDYELATAAAVQIAVLHNFLWHERWTWRAVEGGDAGDRRGGWPAAFARRLAKYEITTGATSTAGNLFATVVLVETLGAAPLAANAAAVALMAAVNFLVSDRWVFARAPVIAGALAAAAASPVAAAEPTPEILNAWNGYVARIEAQIGDARRPPALPLDDPRGETIEAAGGRIHHWRAATLVRGTTVEALVQALTDPGTPPPQDDVLEARVLERSNDTLRVYLKLSRRAIVTVTYDTEHRVTFQRHGPGLATSRSVATKIVETDGRDRGFLWRLNSYWRYAQAGADVRVELESVSLSRDVPGALRPIAGPVIKRIGRESVARTLVALRDFMEKRAVQGPDGGPTTMPPASRPARSRAARSAAPGVSPCTHTVST